MAPSVAAVSTGGSEGGGSTSATVAAPSGSVTGSLLVAVTWMDESAGSASSMTASGWTLVGQNTPASTTFHCKVWRRSHAGAANYTFGCTASFPFTVVIARIIDADAATPIDVAPTFFSTASNAASHSSPSIDPSRAGCLDLRSWTGAAAYSGATYTGMPSGYTEHADLTSPGGWQRTALASALLAGDGATGAKSATFSTSARYASVALAITPAPSGPVVGAGADVPSQKATVQFTRTATEDDGGDTITDRSWTIIAGPAGVGTEIGTAAALAWTPTVAGDYTLQYAATTSAGTGTDSLAVSVYAPGQFSIFDGEAAPTTDVAGAFSFGTEFYVTDPGIYAVGIRWPRATSTSTPDSARLEKVDGTVVAGTAVSLSGGTVGAWNVTNFPARVLLVEGQRYRTVVHYPSRYPGLKSWSPEGRKDGPLESPTNANSTGGGTSRYVSGATIASPTTAYADVLWSDVVVEADSSVIDVTPAGIGSAEAVGAPTLTVGPVGLTATGIGSAEAVGTPRLTLAVTVPGIASAEAAGTPVLIGAGALGPTGIPTAEAVGAPTVTTGPVTLSTTGIPTAEAVGVASVALTVTPAGIGSAEAVGAPTLTVGAVTVTVAGIASAETFGAAAVLAGAIDVTPAGIASAEAVGAPRVSPSVHLAGIASGEAMGAPDLLVGSVTVTVAGIGSAEAVGAPELDVTLDPTVQRGRPELRVPVVTYELICVARIQQAAGPPTFVEVDPIEWKTLSWSSTLSQPQGLSASCPISSITEPVKQLLREPARRPMELWLLRDGQKVFAGPLLGGRRSNDSVMLEATGLLGYLEYWIVEASKRFDQVDQFAIAAWLVDQWQTTEQGHYGIDTSTVGTSGRLRDREFVRQEIHPVGKRLQELGAVADGFDSEVDPVTRKLQLWYPRKGIDRSAGAEAVVFDERVINNVETMFSVAPADLASDAFGSGSKSGGETPLWSAQFNPELRAQFGRSAVTGSWSDVSEQATLDDHVRALLDSRDQALFVPAPGMRVTPDADLSAYDVGDTVQIEMDSAFGVVGAFRIRKRTVRVAETGVESVDLEFV